MKKIIVLICFIFIACMAREEKVLYREFAGTLSLMKAKEYYEKYPKGFYAKKIANILVKFSKTGNQEKNRDLILEIVPENLHQHINKSFTE